MSSCGRSFSHIIWECFLPREVVEPYAIRNHRVPPQIRMRAPFVLHENFIMIFFPGKLCSWQAVSLSTRFVCLSSLQVVSLSSCPWFESAGKLVSLSSWQRYTFFSDCLHSPIPCRLDFGTRREPDQFLGRVRRTTHTLHHCRAVSVRVLLPALSPHVQSLGRTSSQLRTWGLQRADEAQTSLRFGRVRLGSKSSWAHMSARVSRAGISRNWLCRCGRADSTSWLPERSQDASA